MTHIAAIVALRGVTLDAGFLLPGNM
jgi:hypothetical protein